MKKSVRVILGVSVFVLLGLALQRVGAPPAIELGSSLPGIGSKSSEILVRVAESQRGVGRYEVELRQGERIWPLDQREHVQPPFWDFWSDRVRVDELRVRVGRESQPDLQPGEAVIVVIAERAGTWLRRPGPTSKDLRLEVDFSPPEIRVAPARIYVREGGSGVVVYDLIGDSVRDGVRIGDRLFPGADLPGGGDGRRFAFFAIPVDAEELGADAIELFAADDLGNESRTRFVSALSGRNWRHDTINVSDRFFERVVPDILATVANPPADGSLLEKYLWINRDLRRSNRETLGELARESRQQLLWDEPFLQLPGSQSMASFADHRTYLYQGEEVDQQTHLGFDLASVRQAEVPTANRGVVALSEYLGIYGQTVVVDHGFGLMTLYAHLSSISVETGQLIERGEIVGRSGQTGLAGGDHLHYAVLIHGHPVNPIEWWDESWVEQRILSKIVPKAAAQEDSPVE